jgi:hypothetical protein
MPKPRRFNYRPRYYDERKERLEKMKAQAEAELVADKNRVVGSGLEKGFLAGKRDSFKSRRASFEKASFLRFFIILLVIIGVFYFISPEIFMAFWRFK